MADLNLSYEPRQMQGAPAGPDGFEGPPAADDGPISVSEEKPKPANRMKASDRAAQLAISSGVELWHDPEFNGFMSVSKAGHREHYAIKGKAAKRWLNNLFFGSEHRGLSDRECVDAMVLLESMAIHEGSEHPVAVRVFHQEGQVILDLGRPEWNVVEVTAGGWAIRPGLNLPVRFKRPPGLLALPLPKPGGDLLKLKEVLNTTVEGIILALAWLLFALGGSGPYPILALAGEQGTGKSTAGKILREIVDPNSVGLRTVPRDERDLAIAAQNAHILGFDNLSSIPEWLSDSLCRLATGAGFATRALFTDSEETLFSAKRPIILNGIPDLMTRGDLADRALTVTLERIREEDRRPETNIWRGVEAVKPDILGGLLDALVVALRRLPDLNLGSLPRMADFARFIVAAEPALPWMPGEFLATYKEAREDSARILLEGDTIHSLAVAIAIAGSGNPVTPGIWTGTAGDLLVRLNAARTDDKPKGWPTSARALSSHLRRIGPAMRQTGLEVEYSRGGGKQHSRIITLTYVPTNGGGLPSEQSEQAENAMVQRVSGRTQNNGHSPTLTLHRRTAPVVRSQSVNAGRKPDLTVRQKQPYAITQTDGSDGSDGYSELWEMMPDECFEEIL